MTFPRSLFVRCGLLAIFITTLFACAAFGSTEFVIWDFPPVAGMGITPEGTLVADSADNLYGVTLKGGAFGGGTVYQLARPVAPGAGWTWNALYNFSDGGSDGSGPTAGLIFDSAGNLYGTTSYGGAYDLGVVFELSPPTVVGDSWTETVLHSFKGGDTDGESPSDSQGVVFDTSGNLYGATRWGGPYKLGCAIESCGVVYRLTPSGTPGGEWTQTVIHFFNGSDGNAAVGNLMFDAKGNLYGGAQRGGPSDWNTSCCGLIFKLTPPATPGAKVWTYKILYAFLDSPDSAWPNGSLTLHDGSLYGTASEGGADGWGTVFQLVVPTTAGAEWTENILYSFTNSSDGANPSANVTFDRVGNLYTTAASAIELSPPASTGAAWTETTLSPYYGPEDGGGLIFGKDGFLYGTLRNGAGVSSGNGSIFAVAP
jgi:uncharacterized repeat protein (TIGR03803 family)